MNKCHIWQSGSCWDTPSVSNITDSKEMSCLIKLIMSMPIWSTNILSSEEWGQNETLAMMSYKKALGNIINENECTGTSLYLIFKYFCFFFFLLGFSLSFFFFLSLFYKWCPFCAIKISSLALIYFAIISVGVYAINLTFFITHSFKLCLESSLHAKSLIWPQVYKSRSKYDLLMFSIYLSAHKTAFWYGISYWVFPSYWSFSDI